MMGFPQVLGDTWSYITYFKKTDSNEIAKKVLVIQHYYQKKFHTLKFLLCGAVGLH